jgi:hypothetical protein
VVEGVGAEEDIGAGWEVVAAEVDVGDGPPGEYPCGRVDAQDLLDDPAEVVQPGNVVQPRWPAVEDVVDLGVDPFLDVGAGTENIVRPRRACSWWYRHPPP